MRALRVFAAAAALVGAPTASCSGSGDRGFSGGSAYDADILGDGSKPCTNLECKQVDCNGQGRPDTTISGKVWDPAGTVPLYNVFVYVPNTSLDPITPGHPTCTACQAPASGSPIAWATTDANGYFSIAHAPAGDDIPLVMLIGKWRRQVTLAHVSACADNVQTDPHTMRLPAKASEGDMPRIALSTGCDAAECFLRTVGIDDSEFTPGDGEGHVHLYLGKYPGVTMVGATDAYALWASPDKLAHYDIVFTACECQVNARDTMGLAYDAMRTYLDAGGRLYATHFYYNWFAPSPAPADFQSVAHWLALPDAMWDTFFVDWSFPKGKAFADWLDANHFSPAYGQIPITDTRDSVAAVTTATRWVYSADAADAPSYATKYLSFNTPVEAPTPQQCGRAVFSDVHLSGNSTTPGEFPTECDSRFGTHGVDERALEFMFFDLSSCVQNDTVPPPQPPPR
jgi:hypothetical protein